MGTSSTGTEFAHIALEFLLFCYDGLKISPGLIRHGHATSTPKKKKLVYSSHSLPLSKMMSYFSASSLLLKKFFTNEHEWIERAGKNSKAGISNVCQERLGEIVHIAFNVEKGAEVKKGDSLAEIESVKTVGELFAPASGKIVKLNNTLEEKPAMLNQDAEGKGWMVEIETADKFETALMDGEKYKKFCEEDTHH